MSVIHRFTGHPDEDRYTWDNVEPIAINTGDLHNVMKHVLVGAEDGAQNFIIRYFQVSFGGHTFHHSHPHEHGIMILHGQAKVIIEERSQSLSPLDSVFICGDDTHQLINTGDTTLGFLCVIPCEAEE